MALLVLTAGGVELTCGAWFGADPLDRLGLRRDWSLTVSAEHLYSTGGVFPLRRDHWGFRGAATVPAAVTILTLGGDATSQSGLPEEATWQAVMARELDAAGHPAVLANAGLDGHSTADHLRAMGEWLPHVPDLKPRFILFQVGGAEISARKASRFGSAGLWENVRQRSGLLRLVSGWFDDGTPRPLHPAQALPLDEASIAPNAYKARLKEMTQMSHAFGAVPVLVTQPGSEPRFDAYNRATLDVCRDEGLLCLDLAREVMFETGDFYDYLHTTPQGADKIGRWLASKLAGLV